MKVDSSQAHGAAFKFSTCTTESLVTFDTKEDHVEVTVQGITRKITFLEAISLRNLLSSWSNRARRRLGFEGKE